MGKRQNKVSVRPFKDHFWWGDAVECEVKEESSDAKQNPVENTLAVNESTKEDMHNDEGKIYVVQHVLAADDVHFEDEREDCPIPNAESRNVTQGNTPTLAENGMCLNQLKEIYENTSFELNSVVKDADFNGNPNAKTEETLSSVPQQQIDTKVPDSESESAKPEMESA